MMKKIFLIFILITSVLIAFLFLFKTDSEERYDINEVITNNNLTYYQKDMSILNGVVFCEFGDMGLFKNGKKEELHKKWYNNGQLKNELNFKNGLGNGMAKAWHENGKLKMEFVVLNNKNVGEVKYYNENGVLTTVMNYKNGILNGPSYRYYDDGTVYYQYNYKNNKEHGFTRSFTSDGYMKLELNYKDGLKDGFQKKLIFPHGIFGELYDKGVLLREKCVDNNGHEINCDVLSKIISSSNQE